MYYVDLGFIDFLLISIIMGVFMVNLSYLYSSLMLVMVISFIVVFILKNLILYKYMILLIYVGGVIVFMMYISCLCLDTEMKSFIFHYFFGFSISPNWFMIKDFNIMLNFYLMIMIGSFFNFILFFYSMNLFKMPGSLRV